MKIRKIDAIQLADSNLLRALLTLVIFWERGNEKTGNRVNPFLDGKRVWKYRCMWWMGFLASVIILVATLWLNALMFFDGSTLSTFAFLLMIVIVGFAFSTKFFFNEKYWRRYRNYSGFVKHVNKLDHMLQFDFMVSAGLEVPYGIDELPASEEALKSALDEALVAAARRKLRAEKDDDIERNVVAETEKFFREFAMTISELGFAIQKWSVYYGRAQALLDEEKEREKARAVPA